MRRLCAAAAIAALTLLAASCGDDDKATTSTGGTVAAAPDDVTEDDDEDTESTEGDDAAEVTSAPDDTEVDSETEDTDADSGDSDDSGDSGDLSGDCLAIKESIENRFTSDADFGEIADAIDDVKQFTPDDIDDDVEVLSGVYQEMADVIDEYGGNLTEAMSNPEVMEKLESMNSPEVEEASGNVQAYFEERCPGFDS